MGERHRAISSGLQSDLPRFGSGQGQSLRGEPSCPAGWARSYFGHKPRSKSGIAAFGLVESYAFRTVQCSIFACNPSMSVTHHVFGEQTAMALEANLTSLESKLDQLLASFEQDSTGAVPSPVANGNKKGGDDEKPTADK
ncbi:hypothetical protein N0V82_009740 [Gnomoniopsis sp. IMI 355080]|nr:hypothetical protein N0V82_009740 [Gnomoniopsis sp. IMI 355080]